MPFKILEYRDIKNFTLKTPYDSTQYDQLRVQRFTADSAILFKF